MSCRSSRISSMAGYVRMPADAARRSTIPRTVRLHETVGFADEALVRDAVASAAAAFPAWAATPAASSRAGAVPLSRIGRAGHAAARFDHHERARQDHLGRARRVDAWPRSRGVRVRHSATSQRRVQRGCRPCDRCGVAAPAARRRRRDFAVQLSRDGSDVDVSRSRSPAATPS